MKKMVALLLIVVMVLSLAACGTAEEPTDAVYKADVQEYITEFLDETASITIFEKKSATVVGEKLTAVCLAMYAGAAGESKGTFTLTYVQGDDGWTLDKCSVALDSAPESTTPEETTLPTTEATEPVEAGPTEMSDNWKDFTFTLDGVVYELPTHYTNFAKNGWKIDGTRSDISEYDSIGGYSYEYVYLTNGKTYFRADIVNLSGHARPVSNCDIGGISIEANDKVSLTVANGITTASTAEEIQQAFGTPSNTYTSDSSTSLDYDVGSYVSMEFYIYNSNTSYNSISLRNFVAQERDATTPKQERPAYLDTYVAPTELGSDIYSSRFMLDGVVYQLPCPLDAFTDNGWTVKRDGIGTLGAWNEAYGVTLAKGNYQVDLTMYNFSDFETTTQNCAVSGIDLGSYSFEDAPKNIVQLPGGTGLWSTVAEVEKLYKDFERYDGTYSTSFTYYNEDYSAKVYYSYMTDDKYCSIEVENANWNY